MTKILVTGTTTYSDNRGVSAMAACTVKILRKYFPNSEIVIWHSEACRRTSPTTYETNVKIIKERNAYEYFLKIPFRLFLCTLWRLLRKLGNAKILMSEKVLKEYRDADLIISLNYGDAFTDIYGKIESFSIFSQNLLNFLSEKPVVFFPQSIGPFNTGLSKVLAKSILNESKLIMAREEITKKYLSDIGINKRLIHLIPDTAFLLEPAGDKRVKEILSSEGLLIDLKSRKEPVVGISVNPVMAYFSKTQKEWQQYLGTMVKLINYLVKKMGAIVVFVPNVTLVEGFDTRSLGNLIRDKAKHKDRVISINGEYTAEELKGIIKQCDFFIGSLTHTMIAATSINVPTIAIAYSHKTPGVMELVGLGNYVINFKDLSFSTLISKIEKAWGNREKIKKDLTCRIKMMKKRVLSSGELIKNLCSA